MFISVAIIEDDVHYNQALRKVIDHDEDLCCTHQFFHGRSALQHLTEVQPDVAIVDINLKDMSGIQLVEKLRRSGSKMQFIMCTCYEDDANIVDSLKAGASGYLLKGERMDKIISAVKDVFQGGGAITPSVARNILKQFDRPPGLLSDIKLTKTEVEIIRLVGEGLSYKMIADKQYVSIDTVRKHIANIYKKLGVNNKIDAINKFRQV